MNESAKHFGIFPIKPKNEKLKNSVIKKLVVYICFFRWELFYLFKQNFFWLILVIFSGKALSELKDLFSSFFQFFYNACIIINWSEVPKQNQGCSSNWNNSFLGSNKDPKEKEKEDIVSSSPVEAEEVPVPKPQSAGAIIRDAAQKVLNLCQKGEWGPVEQVLKSMEKAIANAGEEANTVPLSGVIDLVSIKFTTEGSNWHLLDSIWFKFEYYRYHRMLIQMIFIGINNNIQQ